MTTRIRLIEAATALLDNGGETAVTLRAVAQAVGVSHNAPYRHFADRAALLGAVAERDFMMLAGAFDEIGNSDQASIAKVRKALNILIGYGESSPARYRLLFSDPAIPLQRGSLEEAATAAFAAFAKIVASAQASNELPALPTAKVAGLIYGTVHGLIDLQAGGRLRAEKGLATAAEGLETLLDIIASPTKPEDRQRVASHGASADGSPASG